MGIGISLATGLVQGFTKNIEEERARRKAESDRLEGYNQILIQSALNPGEDYSATNAALLGNMIKNAKGELDDRERVNIFGQRGKDVDTDFTSILPLLQAGAADDDDDDIKDTISFDDVTYKFKRNLRDSTDFRDDVSIIRELVTAIQIDPDKWINAPKQIHEEFFNIAQASAGSLMTDFYFKASDFEANLPALDQLGILPLGESFDQYYKMVNKKYDGSLIADGFNFAVNNKAEQTDDPARNESAATDTSDNPTEPIAFTIAKPTEQEAPYQTALMKRFNATPANFARVMNAYYDVPGFGREKKERLFDATIDYATKFKLSSAFKATSIADLGVNQANEMLVFLKNNTGTGGEGDLVEMAFILGVFQEPMKLKKQARPKFGGVPGTSGKKEEEVAIRTAKLVAAQTMLRSTATEEDFIKLEDTDAALAAVLSADTGLMALYNMADKEFLTSPIVSNYAGDIAIIKNVFGFLFNSDESDTPVNTNIITARGAASTNFINVSQADMYGVNAVTGESEAVTPDGTPVKKVMTREFISDLNSRIEERRQAGRNAEALIKADGTKMSVEEMGRMYARFESLRISLAFQMARAADPSGRLSNQDIIQQLARLGEDIDTPAMMKDRIQFAIRDFQRQKNRYGHMMKYKDTSGPVTPDIERQIIGHHAVTQLARRAGYETGAMAVSAMTQNQRQTVPAYSVDDKNVHTIMLDGKKYIVNKGGIILDGSSYLEITDPELLKTLRSADGIPPNYLPPTDASLLPAANTVQTQIGV